MNTQPLCACIIKRLIFWLVISCFMAIMPVFASDLKIEDAFSPHQGATELVVKTIGEARQSIRVAAYSFTSQPIAEALVDAYRHGIDVRVVLDKSQPKSRFSMLRFLADHNVPLRIDTRYAIMHDKFMVIDDHILELGSFNYTQSAESRNAENVLVIHDDTRAAIRDYARQWDKLWGESGEITLADVTRRR